MSQLKGKRALVTGASSGIGAAIAHELARRGVHLVLSARRRTQLEDVATTCADHGVATEVIPADLGQHNAAARLWQAAARTNVDILINNAGFGYFRSFAEVDWARDAELVQLNITSLVQLSRLFVDHQRVRQDRSSFMDIDQAREYDHRTYLMNIASIGAYQSVPNNALYSASKAFVRNFTEALHDEFKGTSLSVTCICPGGTKTEFHAVAGAGDYGWIANHSMMTADRVARIAVDAMVRGKRNVIPGLINKLSCWGVRFVPRSFASWMSRRILGKPRPGELPARTTKGAA